jgi:hypothetical protein
MKTEKIALDQLKAPERNVRVHPQKQIAEIARSVKQFGQIRPIIIDEDNTVLAGNGLVEGFKSLGRTDIEAYRYTGLSPAQKTKLMLADNKVYSLGLDDQNAIFDAIRTLDDFDIPGFDADILAGLMADAPSVADFGVLSDEAKAKAQTQDVGTGSTTAPPATPPDADDLDPGDPDAKPSGQQVVSCPNCSHTFAIR